MKKILAILKREKAKKNEDNHFLSCVSNLDKNDPRIVMIKKAIKDRNVKNIGIIGEYGAGKSSIVKSYIESKKINKQTIYFSWDTLNQYETDVDVIKIIFTELLKRNTASVLLDNYYKKLFSFRKGGISAFLFLSIILSFSSLVTYYVWIHYWGWPSLFLGILIAATSILIGSKIKSCKVRFSFKDIISVEGEANIKEDGKYYEKIKDHPGLVETAVIKDLRTKKIRYMVFEDIDRYYKDTEKAITFIKKLKIINDLINQSKEFKPNYRKIIFFYELKDSFFVDSEVRTKYFDLIIPVIPYANHLNAADSILQDEFIKSKVSRDVLTDLSIYLLDQRQVNAVLCSFDINKDLTYSENLLNELFALTIFSVRFPSIYSLLYQKNNFLNRILDTFNMNNNSPINISEDVLKKMNSITDRQEFELFIKTCVKQKYLTKNYELLLHTKIGNDLVSGDLKFLKLYQAGSFQGLKEYDILNPKAILLYKEDSTYLLKDKRGLNAKLLIHILENKNESSKMNKYYEAAKTQLLSFSNTDMGEYLNDLPIEQMESLYNLISSSFYMDKLYYASTLIKDNDARLNAQVKLFNNLTFDIIQNNALQSDYIKNINEKDFNQKCGRFLDSNIISLLIKKNVFCPEYIRGLEPTEEIIKLFKETSNYIYNFDNLNFLFDTFYERPLNTFNTNEKLFPTTRIIQMSIKEVLDKCNINQTKDNLDDVTTFFDKIGVNKMTECVSSTYFDNWKYKIKIQYAKNDKIKTLFKRGLLDLCGNGIADEFARDYPEEFLKTAKEEIDYFKMLKFNNATSWLLVANLESKEIESIKSALNLNYMEEKIKNTNEFTIKIIFDLFKENEKNNLIDYLVLNKPHIVVQMYKDKKIAMDDLKGSIINEQFISYLMENSATELLKLGISPKNSITLRQYIIKFPNYNYRDIFQNEDDVLLCKDIELIIQYCINQVSNLNHIGKLIKIIPSSIIGNLNLWMSFLDLLKDDDKESTDIVKYYRRDDDIKDILLYFKEIGFFSKVYTTHNTIRCDVK